MERPPVMGADKGLDMKMLIGRYAIGVAWLLLVMPIWAQGPREEARRAELVKKYDKDGDGVLSDEERSGAWRGAHQGELKRRTGNAGSGVLRNDDMIQTLIRQYDKDGDGQLSYDEMAKLRNDTASGTIMPKNRMERP